MGDRPCLLTLPTIQQAEEVDPHLDSAGTAGGRREGSRVGRRGGEPAAVWQCRAWHGTSRQALTQSLRLLLLLLLLLIPVLDLMLLRKQVLVNQEASSGLLNSEVHAQ